MKFDPMQELDQIQARLAHLFPFRAGRLPEAAEGFFADWLPAIDVHETDTEYVVKADLPDVQKQDVKIQLQEGVLTIEGERKREKEEKGRKFHKTEREYGKFVRRFVLPTEIEPEKIHAEFKDGVLHVQLPKSEKAAPKTIEVKVG